MRKIKLQDWHRKEHYLFFQEFEYPYFSLCVDMDISNFLPRIKDRKITFTGSMMYLIARTANGIPEFRQRVREGDPIEHSVVHPSATILSQHDLFTFCTVEYEEDFPGFIHRAEEEITSVKIEPALENRIQDDSMLFMSSIPWVSFTAFMHPLKLDPADSVPRFAWGKYRHEGDRIILPLSVQGHHAVMDGLHAGIFYQEIQALLDNPDRIAGL
jgi:chloramphenicol O-acetyltransferase type A